jgi:hypothetical protein
VIPSLAGPRFARNDITGDSMNRRNVLKKLGIISSLPLLYEQNAFGKETERSIYELRRYKLPTSHHHERFDGFMTKAFMPALSRLNIKPVGVFSPLYFADTYSEVYLLIPYSKVEDAFRLNDQLFSDKEFLEAGEEYINASPDNPVYTSYKNSIMIAFEDAPEIELHDICINKKRRIFNLRTYSSQTVKACKKKIEMFNSGGEIDVFREVGMKLIFFGEAIFGDRLPNLSYMHVWEDLQTYDELGEKFWNHPKWVEIREMVEYKNIVTDYFSVLLKPKNYSQI